MSSFLSKSAWGSLRFLVVLAVPALQFTSPIQAKTAGLNAIEIYPDPNGQSFEQLADFVLNGKNEVYPCGGATSFDKSAYHKLNKVGLGPGMVLERDSKGVLMLTFGADAPYCVVPGNIKFEGSAPLSASDLADRALVEGRVLPGGDPLQTQIAPIKPGVKLVFVAAPDQEFAEFLRAERASGIRPWKDFLDKNGSGAHATAARKALAALYVPMGDAGLNAYDRSKGGNDPDYAKLKEARQMADLALAQVSDDAATVELNKKIHDRVLTIAAQSKEKLNLYEQAFKSQLAGYVNLPTAEKLADGAYIVEPATREAADVESQSKQARAAFDKILHDNEAQLAGGHTDEAVEIIAAIKAFAPENKKIADDLQAITDHYIAHAKKLEEASDWAGAATDLEKASAVVPSPETAALLSEARKEALIAANKAAAEAAIEKSKTAETAGDAIASYEVLDDLPPDQRALAVDRIESLKDNYVKAADKAAKAEQKAHEPINGVEDEREIQRAYQYLTRCYGITNDPGLQDRITILGEDLTGYYLQQGKRYADKPDGSGVNIAWTYLTEALEYKSPTRLGTIHDEMTTVRAAHLLKSRISVRVEFREGTSRREAVEFAPQLTDAMATGLESAGSGVKVIRPQDSTAVQPNFQLVGEVMRHELSKSQDTVAKTSKYRFGQEQVPNDKWNTADQEYQKANLELASARSTLEGAQAHGKKKEIGDAQKVVQDDEKKVEDLLAKRNSIPQTISHDQERDYSYSQITYHLKVIVELQFRILDSSGNEVVPRITAKVESPKDYVILQNVKPEDTMGVRNEGSIPNENELLEDGEYRARNELIDKAKAHVAELPAILLAAADRKAADNDGDAAAELYILYLDATPVADSPERLRVRKFLADQFNFKNAGKTAFAE